MMKKISLFMAMLICFVCCADFKVEAAQKRTVFLFGDSRTCGLALSIDVESEPWILIGDNKVQDDRGTIVYERGNTRLVISMYGGGSISNKGFDTCVEYFLDTFYTYETNYNIVVNAFGTGDSNKLESARVLNDFNRLLQYNLGDAARCFQCTVGPIDDEGQVAVGGVWTNPKIKMFNRCIKQDSSVPVIDVAQMLDKEEEVGYINTVDDESGIHYTEDINKKILWYILDQAW